MVAALNMGACQGMGGRALGLAELTRERRCWAWPRAPTQYRPDGRDSRDQETRWVSRKLGVEVAPRRKAWLCDSCCRRSRIYYCGI